jgi:hypothetical protein
MDATIVSFLVGLVSQIFLLIERAGVNADEFAEQVTVEIAARKKQIEADEITEKQVMDGSPK